MLTEQEKETFRALLLNEMAAILKRLENSEMFNLKQSYPHETVGELSSYDNHPADEGTELFEREKDFALLEHEQNYLKDVQRALAAIDHGSYGVCDVCGQPIPMERLIAIPTTTHCKLHSSQNGRRGDRPEEERVIAPSMHRAKSASFDADDLWQEVAQWGTSETPSDFFGDMTSYKDMMEPEENHGYVEDYENFVGVDLYGKNVTVFFNKERFPNR
ncbi:TraR/DksA C4-type zinc finger protein [Fervidibacillus albus]|uniref:TraR/DksA C4-type zinc finger protein n=1 Tax=Fervidibacillus albus TaxID=2980026 RepID=A0A9E8RVT8_9BACI|nr:TraR/DksA C4-type zinc finger protein [Fervidibacillus albus]WAA11025.1 TraR/DksA C4-type zinc finger protein [Fervidibacillus albus]